MSYICSIQYYIQVCSRHGSLGNKRLVHSNSVTCGNDFGILEALASITIGNSLDAMEDFGWLRFLDG